MHPSSDTLSKRKHYRKMDALKSIRTIVGENAPNMLLSTAWPEQLTLRWMRLRRRRPRRSIVAGLVVGSILCCSNTYFGLQTGWITMGSLQSALLGYGIFRGLSQVRPPFNSRFINFSMEENVILQTTAVATATMPLAAGLVGIIPAFGLLSEKETGGHKVVFGTFKLLLWALSMAFFGVFIAIPLRRQVILKEKLRFPSGTATARVIRILHETNNQPPPGGQAFPAQSQARDPGAEAAPEPADPPGGNVTARLLDDGAVEEDPEAGVRAAESERDPPAASQGQTGSLPTSSRPLGLSDMAPLSVEPPVRAGGGEHGAPPDPAVVQDFQRSWRWLMWTFAGSSWYTLMQFMAPKIFLKSWQIFNWFGIKSASKWGWEIQMAAGYFGQGMIMGPKVCASMLLGAFLGWAVLGPAAKSNGWAPGPIGDWQSGAAGWILWISLAVMLGDSLCSLAILVIAQVLRKRMDAKQEAAGAFGAEGSGHGPGAQVAIELTTGGVKSDKASRSELDSEPSGSTAAQEVRISAAGDPPASQVSDRREEPEAPQARLIPAAALSSGGVPAAGALAAGGNGNGLVRRSSPLVRREGRGEEASDDGADDAGTSRCGSYSDVPRSWWLPGAIGSTLLGSLILTIMFAGYKVMFFQPLFAFAFSTFVAVLAVRALGETDLNPVSGVGKLSQLLFGLLAPGNVVANLVAGAIAEAGAMQAGDLMQDFKAAHLLDVCPRSQIIGQLVGSFCSVFVSVFAFKLYSSQSKIPGPEFPAPTAGIWVQMARLANGGRLLPKVKPFCACAFVLAVLNQIAIDVPHNPTIRAFLLSLKYRQIAPTLDFLDRVSPWLPSGIGMAVGMYVAPKWTLPRVIGSIGEQIWVRKSPQSHAQLMLVLASGLVLGEGTASIVVAVIRSLLG